MSNDGWAFFSFSQMQSGLGECYLDVSSSRDPAVAGPEAIRHVRLIFRANHHLPTITPASLSKEPGVYAETLVNGSFRVT